LAVPNLRGGSAFAAAVGADKVDVAPAERYAVQRPFGSRIVDLDVAVIDVASQRIPQLELVQDRRRRVGLAR
jgi:hypothetical protein